MFVNIYRLNRTFVTTLNNVYRQLSASLNSNVKSICGTNGPQRAICTSAVRLQDSAAPTTEEPPSEFTYFPPLPGEKSSLRWDGKPYEELPIVHIKATYNNTHIHVTDSAGACIVCTSCGKEGFKNIKKSTPVAAQTTGLSAGVKAKLKGVTFVRVVFKGLGGGRLSAIQGLVMGGLEIVSITDNTPVPHNGCRPQKVRRL